MYKFKTNLMEGWTSQVLKRFLPKIGIGWIHKGDHLEGPNGYSIHMYKNNNGDNYYHLHQNGKHTGITGESDDTFVKSLRNFFRGG